MRIAFAAIVVFVLGVVGCAFDSTPQLIQVLEYAPHEAEVGDRIELMGAGFPQGRPAHLTFRGTLHRPGEKPVTGAEIAAEGTVTSPQHIELAFTDSLQALFCGGGDRALHTTFEGEIEVAFSVASPRDPPIAGTLRRVSIDFRPAEGRPETTAARIAEGDRALVFMGIHAKEDAPASGGIVVAAVDGASRADEAGIGPGDVITRFDDVRVVSKADALPPPGAQTVSLYVRHGDDPREQPRTVNVDGFRPAPPTDLLAAAVILAAAAAIVLLFVAPTSSALGWVERRVAARMQRAAPRGGAVVAVVAFAKDFWAQLAFVRAAPLVVFGGATAMFLALPFGQYLAGAEADAGILFLLAFTAYVSIAIVTGAFRAREPWTFGRAARALLDAVSTELPGAIAILSVVVAAGTLRVQEIIRAQGGYPWDWYALRSPVTLVLFGLCFATILVDDERDPRELVEADLGPSRRALGAPRATFFLFAEQAKTIVTSGLVAALFLGGWALPGVAPAQQESSRALEIAGAVLFALKAWTLVLAVAWARWTLPRVPASQMTKAAWKYLVPAALGAFLLSLAWLAWSPGRGAQRMTSMALTAAAALAVAYFAQRVRHGLRAAPDKRARVALNPFL